MDTKFLLSSFLEHARSYDLLANLHAAEATSEL